MSVRQTSTLSVGERVKVRATNDQNMRTDFRVHHTGRIVRFGGWHGGKCYWLVRMDHHNGDPDIPDDYCCDIWDHNLESLCPLKAARE